MNRPVAMPTHAPPSPVSATHSPPIESVLAPLSQRYILVYPVLQITTGSAKAALMLSQMLYWTRTYLASRPERGGWFWHTQQDWRASTGLSRHEQDHARAALMTTGFVEERRTGALGRMHFRVDIEALGRAIARHTTKATDERWDEATLKALLGRPVAFLRGLVDIGGSFTAGYYLSDLCQQQRALERNALHGYITLNGAQRELDAGGGWLDLPLGDTANRLGLTTRRLRLARQTLIAAGLIEECSSGGVQPRTLSRVNLQALTRALAELHQARDNPSVAADEPATQPSSQPQKVIKTAPKEQQAFDFTGKAETYIPEVTKPAIWNGGNVQSRGDETGKLDVTKPAIKNAGFVTSIKVVNTKKEPLKPQLLAVPNEDLSLKRRRSSDFAEDTVQNPAPALAEVTEQTPSAIDLVLPDGLDEAVLNAARHLLAGLPNSVSKQDVADEWAGQVACGKVNSLLGYLHGLVKRAQRGDFVPAMALQVAKNRERRYQNEAALALARDPRSVGAQTNDPTPDEPARRKGVPEFFKDTVKELGLQTRGNECRI